MIKRFFLAFLIFGLIGCSDSDSDSQNLEINSATISGKWYLKGDKFHGGTYESHSNYPCVDSKDNIEFQSNSTLKYNFFAYDCETPNTEITTWNLQGNKLEMGGIQESIVPIVYLYVVKITKNELILNEVAGPDYSNNQDGYGALHYYTRY